jgi:2-polyprenyl-3-methyl-5-hydroxy-6-metoxy-1,4-benzoquinol methylase
MWTSGHNVESRLSKKFGRVFRWNLFFGKESRSGRGSDADQTEVLRAELPKLLRDLGVTSLLDLPCGDLNWISKTNLDGISYKGVDVVPDLISKLAMEHPQSGKSFEVADITYQVPSGNFDAILCRDLFVHLSTIDIAKALHNLKKTGATYLLTTHFSDPRPYRNLPQIPFRVGWRPINFLMPPFRFPTPLALLNEKCTEAKGQFSDKSIGVWRLQDLEIKP